MSSKQICLWNFCKSSLMLTWHSWLAYRFLLIVDDANWATWMKTCEKILLWKATLTLILTVQLLGTFLSIIKKTMATNMLLHWVLRVNRSQNDFVRRVPCTLPGKKKWDTVLYSLLLLLSQDINIRYEKKSWIFCTSI